MVNLNDMNKWRDINLERERWPFSWISYLCSHDVHMQVVAGWTYLAAPFIPLLWYLVLGYKYVFPDKLDVIFKLKKIWPLILLRKIVLTPFQVRTKCNFTPRPTLLDTLRAYGSISILQNLMWLILRRKDILKKVLFVYCPQLVLDRIYLCTLLPRLCTMLSSSKFCRYSTNKLLEVENIRSFNFVIYFSPCVYGYCASINLLWKCAVFLFKNNWNE